MKNERSTYNSSLDCTNTFDDRLELLAWGLAEHGCDPFEGTIQSLASFARIHEVAPVAAAVLVNTQEPEVARIRAFGRVVRRLSAPPVAPVAEIRPTQAKVPA